MNKLSYLITALLLCASATPSFAADSDWIHFKELRATNGVGVQFDYLVTEHQGANFGAGDKGLKAAPTYIHIHGTTPDQKVRVWVETWTLQEYRGSLPKPVRAPNDPGVWLEAKYSDGHHWVEVPAEYPIILSLADSKTETEYDYFHMLKVEVQGEALQDPYGGNLFKVNLPEKS